MNRCANIDRRSRQPSCACDPSHRLLVAVEPPRATTTRHVTAACVACGHMWTVDYDHRPAQALQLGDQARIAAAAMGLHTEPAS